MQFVNGNSVVLPIVTEWEQVLPRLELVGRVSYKSEDKITPETAKPFVVARIKEGHLAVLEHVRFRVAFKEEEFSPRDAVNDPNGVYNYADKDGMWQSFTLRDLIENGETSAVILSAIARKLGILHDLSPVIPHVSLTNIDAAVDVLSDVYLDPNYITAICTTDRGVTHELVRHRMAAFCQESTRYVNYNKRGMAYIDPYEGYLVSKIRRNVEPGSVLEEAYTNFREESVQLYLQIEHLYNKYNQKGITPEILRDILPNKLKSDIAITAHRDCWGWMHYQRTSKFAHPSMFALMQNLMPKMYDQIKEYADMAASSGKFPKIKIPE